MTIAESNEPISSNISKIIRERCLKQCMVAEKAGFTPTALNAMLNGRKVIKPCDAIAVAGALGVPIEELYKKGDE